MKLYLPLSRVHWLTRRGYWFALAGVGLIVLSEQLRGVGFVTGLMLVLSGGLAGGFRRWLHERGMWMLALVALVAWVPLYATLEWDAIRQQRRAPNGPLLFIWDTLLGASVLWYTVRFLATVVRVNRALSALPRPVVVSVTGPSPG